MILTVTDADGDVNVTMMEDYIQVNNAFPATPGLLFLMIVGFIGIIVVIGIIIKRRK